MGNPARGESMTGPKPGDPPRRVRDNPNRADRLSAIDRTLLEELLINGF